MNYFLVIFLFVISAYVSSEDDIRGLFSGRVSKVNPEASLLRIKVDFSNMKYLNKQDKIEFWGEQNPKLKCRAYIVGKTSDYFLIRVPDFEFCSRAISVTPGSYMKFYSQDLVNNIKMGEEVMSILIKKRLALSGKMTRNQKELDSYPAKKDAVNTRYTLLREQLELEWKEELEKVEEDRLVSLRNFHEVQGELDELDHKMETYKIEDQNLKEDRWSIDSRLYFKK